MGRAGLAGFVVGAGWGIAARGWMRLVSREPEFSWSGTLLIVAISAVLGWGVGVSVAARHTTGWRRWMRLAVVPGMLLFAGQGAPFLPAFIVAGPLLRRRSHLAGLVAGTAVLAPAVLLWWSERFDEATMTSAPLRVQLALLVGMPALATVVAWAGSLAWGPSTPPGQSDSPDLARSSRRNDSSLDVPAGPA